MAKVERVVVPGDIGEYKDGDIILDRATIASYYRMCASEGAMPEIVDAINSLSDDQVHEIIEQCPTEGLGPEDIDVVRCVKLETHVEEVLKKDQFILDV